MNPEILISQKIDLTTDIYHEFAPIMNVITIFHLLICLLVYLLISFYIFFILKHLCLISLQISPVLFAKIKCTNLFLENCNGDTCTQMGVLKKGKHLQSKNGIFKLTLQENGSLEILCRNKSIWSTDTITDNVDFMYLKTNGKLVLYGKDETDVWETDTSYSVFEPQKLQLKNDGNLVLLDQFNSVVWASATDSVCDQGL